MLIAIDDRALHWKCSLELDNFIHKNETITAATARDRAKQIQNKTRELDALDIGCIDVLFGFDMNV